MAHDHDGDTIIEEVGVDSSDSATAFGAPASGEDGGGNGAGSGPPTDGKRSRRRKGRDRMPSAPREVAAYSSRAPGGGGFMSWIPERPNPAREALEQQAAQELKEAASPSLDLLVANVPGAHSPDEAYQSIERSLEPAIPDPDGVIPRHPLWSDDTIVFYHLRRHFGENAGTQSQQRRRPNWYPIRSFGPLQ